MKYLRIVALLLLFQVFGSVIMAQSTGGNLKPTPVPVFLQNAATTPGNGSTLPVLIYGAAVVEVSGTFSGTLTFQGSIDGVWTDLIGRKLSTDIGATTTTTTGKYFVAAPGVDEIRVVVTSIGSGSVTVKGRAIPSIAKAAGGGGGGNFNPASLPEIAAPSTPAADSVYLYAKDVGGTSSLFFKKDNGIEIDLAAAGGTGLTSLNGQTGATQTFTNDTNVTIASGSNAHVITWSGTLAKARQNAATVYNDAANTWSTGAQDFSAATSLKVPVIAGAAPATEGLIAVDSTSHTLEVGLNGVNKTVAMTDSNVATATALQNARTIGGVSFDGTANITVASATGGFTVSGGNLALGTNTLTLTGSIGSTGARSTKGWFTDLEVTNAIVGSVTGNAATVTTNANLTGDVTSSGNATTIGSSKVTSAMIVDGTIVNGDIANTTIDLTAKVTGLLPAANIGVNVLDQSVYYAADAGANDTYAITLSPAPAGYVTGAHYRFKANTVNTGAATINVNSLGAKTIKKAAGGITTDLADNDIRAGQFVDLVYDGTNMQMQSLLGNAAAGSGTVTSIATTSPITGGTITATGTIACATCVTSSAALTSTAIVTGAGSQGSQTPSATATLDSSGNLSSPGTASFGVGGSASGAAVLTEGTLPTLTANAVFHSAAADVVAGGVGYVWGGSAAASGVLRVVNSSGIMTVTQDAGISHLAASSSADLRGVLSDENGTGVALFDAANAAALTSPNVTTSITTPSTTFSLVNATATTINFAGAATTLNIGTSATVLNFGGGATAAELRFLEPSGSGTNYSAFKAVAQGANITYSLPATVGGAGTFLRDAAGNGVLDWATPTGTGTVTATGGSLTANSVVLGAGTTDTKVVAGIITDGTSKLTLGVAGASVGSVDFKNATSGTITIAPVTGALGTVTLSLPAATGTLTTSGAALTSTAVVTGAGSQGIQTPAATTTLDSSGNFSTGGNFTAGAGSGNAGVLTLTEGTAPAAAGANTIQLQAPVDVTTAYDLILPVASTTGFLLNTNASNVGTLSIVGSTGTGNVVRTSTPGVTSPDVTTSITTPSTTFSLVNATATTVNFAGAATTLNVGTSATVLNFGGGATAAELRFLEPSGSGTNYSAFKAVAQGANITYSLPATVGGAGTFLRDAAGNGVLDWAVPSGTGTVTATGGSLTSNSVVLGAGTTDTKVVAGIITDGTSKLTLGVAGTSVGSVDFKNATSGTITVSPVTGALGTVTLSLPAATDTLVGKATTDTFTNKTLSSTTDVVGGVTMTLGSDATGDVYYRNSSGVLTRVAAGAQNTVFTMGASSVPAWSAATQYINAIEFGALPDSSGNVFLEPYPVKATNDFWKHGHFVFNDTATDDSLYGKFELNRGCTSGATVTMVWTTTATTGNARYTFSYRVITGTDANSLDQATSVEDVTITSTAPGAANRRISATFTPTNSNFATAGTVEWKLTRTGTNGGDTLAAAAQVVGLTFSCTP